MPAMVPAAGSAHHQKKFCDGDTASAHADTAQIGERIVD
jgi:hypothetical protein